MRTSIILILSCASMLGADTNIQVVTTCTTNADIVFAMDVFTRDGQTNLMRTTTTHSGVVVSRDHWFYHGGGLVGKYLGPEDSLVFIAEASPYSVILKSWPSNDVTHVYISTKDRVVLDYFTATNGVFYPAHSLAVQEMGRITSRMSELLHSVQE